MYFRRRTRRVVCKGDPVEGKPHSDALCLDGPAAAGCVVGVIAASQRRDVVVETAIGELVRFVVREWASSVHERRCQVLSSTRCKRLRRGARPSPGWAHLRKDVVGNVQPGPSTVHTIADVHVLVCRCVVGFAAVGAPENLYSACMRKATRNGACVPALARRLGGKCTCLKFEP